MPQKSETRAAEARASRNSCSAWFRDPISPRIPQPQCKIAVPRLHRLAMVTLERLGAATPLEAMAVAGVARESLQPRFSELRAMGYVERTGERRRNPSGRTAAVLRLTEEGLVALRAFSGSLRGSDATKRSD